MTMFLIVFCPVCRTSQDVAMGTIQGPVELNCESCGQMWTMLVDPKRFAEHTPSDESVLR